MDKDALLKNLAPPPESPSVLVAYGDGVGPEIMEACLSILARARANLNITTLDIGKSYYSKGVVDGIPPSAWDELLRDRVLLMAPIATPEGASYSSILDTLSEDFDLERCQTLCAKEWHEMATECCDSPEEAGAAYLSDTFALFTTGHAPQFAKADTNTANLSAMLHATLMMLAHLDQNQTATRIFKAWKSAPKDEAQMLGTREYAAAIAQRLEPSPAQHSFTQATLVQSE